MSGGASQTDVAPLPPGQTRLAYFRLCKEGIAVDALVTPEAYTSDALERLVVGERTDKLKMPSVELMITQVPSV